MSRKRVSLLALAALATSLIVGAAWADDGPKLTIGGTTYTKWLWGTQRNDGSVYNFTTVPGEGYGDNGQGSEVELLLNARLSRFVEVQARLHSRFNQNQWTNFGGFGGEDNGAGGCQGGDCGENDPRSNQYVKLRGVRVTVTPGYKWVDTVAIGANDFGMFDPFVIGRIRYIDRDNASGLLFQGSFGSKKFGYDITRISLPRLWAGPSFNTGEYAGADAAYGAQFKFTPNSKFDIALIGQYVNDIEVDSRDNIIDDGQDIRTRFRNRVMGARVGVHPLNWLDLRGAYYDSNAQSDPNLGTPSSFFGISGFSPVPAGQLDDSSWKFNADFNDPFSVGLSFNAEYFDIGAQYVSMMAARRESDVLLTEGHDAAFAFPGPSNAAFGVFSGNPSRIGYGGWDGNAQQVATINVDNEFTDFDEPLAETVIGWKGFTVAPVWRKGDLEIGAEYTDIGYNTNWQAFDDPSRSILSSIYPVHELDTGVGHNFRSAYAPFQDKSTKIMVLHAKYVLPVAKGIDVWAKVKLIDETDKRMNNARFLPYAAGDCPPGSDGEGCNNQRRFYFGNSCDSEGGSPSNCFSTAELYGNPGIVEVGERIGYQWKPFDSLSDDDRDLDYTMFQLGAGYQLTDDLYGSVQYERFDADLLDGNTAFQAYQLHEMASGKHKKDKLTLRARYNIGGAEFGFEYQYNQGDFTPNFGGGFLPQRADSETAAAHNVKVGSLGFSGRFGGWNSLEKRDFEQQRIKAFMKVQF